MEVVAKCLFSVEIDIKPEQQVLLSGSIPELGKFSKIKYKKMHKNMSNGKWELEVELKFRNNFNQPLINLFFPSHLKLLSVSILHPEYELINIKQLYKYRCRAKIEMVRIYYWYNMCSKRYNKLFINYGSKIDVLMYLPENEELENWWNYY